MNFRSDVDFVRALAIYDPLMLEAEGRATRVLAESVEPERDGRAWTIRLREGIHFHDGSPATAADVLHTLRKIADPKAPGDGAQALAEVDFARSRKLDERTVRLVLRTPLGDFDQALARAYAMLLREGHDDPKAANGTGPFRLKEFRPGQSTELARVADSWRPAAQGPFLDELQILSIVDPTARLNGLRGGQADFDFDVAPTAARQLATKHGDVRLVRSAAARYSAAFAMNVTKRPFDDPRVRQAVKLAVDREELVQKALLGFGEIANDLSAKGRPYYADDLPQRQHDPEQARALLKTAGADGAAVKLMTSAAVPGASGAAPLFAQQLRAVGFDVQLDEVPADQFYSDIRRLVDAPLKVWGGPLGSVVADLQAFTKTAPFNGTAWTDVTFDRKLAAARATLDEGERKQLLHDAQQILWESGGLVVWGIGETLHAQRSTVSGVQIAAFGRYPTFDRARAGTT